MRASKQQGFTIVELLIVIVVIAILAAISVVAYTGIQDRAEASKTATAIKAYKDALEMYKVDKGNYPNVWAFCLGDQYGVFTGQSTPSCRYSTAPIDDNTSVTYRDELKPYLGGQLPMPSTKLIHSGTIEFVGGYYYGSMSGFTIDGRPAIMIEYYIKGDTCPVGPVYTWVTGGVFASPAVSRSSALSDGSRCYLVLPND